MSTVIKVENLSKRYRLGLKEARKDTLFAQLGQALSAPVRNFNRLRSMTKFGKKDESVFWALEDINFEVKQGDVLGIIGHNGAGKSTLLKLLSRITEPTTGSIRLKGRVAALLEVGTGFHQDLSGRENIYMNGTILGMTKKEIDRKLDEIVAFSGVEQHLDTPVKFYSSGMKVRLGFSVAAHLDPEILIVDEVLAVGDAEFQKKCLGKMESVADTGRTVLFVSHNMEAVQNLCSSAIILNKGRLTYSGLPKESVNTYLKTYFPTTHKSEWDFETAPGDNRHKILSVQCINHKKDSLFFYMSEEIELQFNYWTANESDDLDITYHLRDELGILVMVDSSGLKSINKKGKGLYKMTATIPGGILNQGSYSLQKVLLVANKGQVMAVARNPVSFEILPNPNSRFGWQGQKEGVIKLNNTTWERTANINHKL